MLTKLMIKRLEKMGSTYAWDEETGNKILHNMESVIDRSASGHERQQIYSKFYNTWEYRSGDESSERDELQLIALDVYEKYNATPEIKSMCRHTKKSADLRYDFFVGNKYGILAEQKDANEHGTHEFTLYEQGGYSQASNDDDYINEIKKGRAMNTPNPADLIDDPDAIMKNIKIGKLVKKGLKPDVVHSDDEY